MIDANQDWQVQLKAVTTSLNQRLFVIRRIQNQLPKDKLLCVVHSLWMSRLRYGLQLYSRSVLKEEDPRSSTLKTLQITQNRMLRAINKTKICDRISVQSMLKKFNLLSVNQLAIQIKLTEVWKSINVPSHPLRLEPFNDHSTELSQMLRARPNRIYNDSSKLGISQSSFHVDAARIWNQAPASIIGAKSLGELKKATLKYVSTLPI